MLEVKNLSVTGKNGAGLLNQISFCLKRGMRLGLTGTSGSGKTTLVKTIMGVQDETCCITSGEILLEGVSLLSQTAAQRRELCGITLGFIPQNPMTAFSLHRKIGNQLKETFRLRLHLTKEESGILAEQVLKEVNLPDTKRILDSYPNQLSGGMLQRITMAVVWGLRPTYILADEPTSALDEANRDHLLRLFHSYPQNVGILFLSHDVEALKMLCGEIMVVEGGAIIEHDSTKQLFESPEMPWTKRFVASANEGQGGEWEWMES